MGKKRVLLYPSELFLEFLLELTRNLCYLA
jgi:hypothetical protein